MTHMPLMCSISPDAAQLQHLANDSTTAATTDTVCTNIMDVLMADSTTSCAPSIVAGGSAVWHVPAKNNRASPSPNGHNLEGAVDATVAAVAGPMPLQDISTDTLNGQLLLLQQQQQQQEAAKDAAACKQRKGSLNIAAKQHDQVSKPHLEEPATDAKHLQLADEELQEHSPKRQKQQDLDTICNTMLQQLAACIQQSRHTQQQGNGGAVRTEPNREQTSSAPRSVRSTFGSAEANQPMEVDVADDDTDEDAAALGLIMMLHSRENSDEEGPQQPAKLLGANRLTVNTLEHSMQQQQRHKRRRQDRASCLQEASALHSNTASAKVHQAAHGPKAVGCVQGAVTCFRSGALSLQHKLDFVPVQAKVNTQHVTEQHHTAKACAEPNKAAAQAALSAAGSAAGTPRVAAQLLKQIQGLLQQQQGGNGSAGHAAATAPERTAAAAGVTGSASSLLPANLLAAAAAPWYPCGGKGGLMLRRNGKLVARKLYCMQTGTTLTKPAAAAAGALRAEVCGIKRADDMAVGQQQQQAQLANQPCSQQHADAGNTAVSSVPADEQAGVQLLLDAAAAGDIDAACNDDVQQHSVKQLTDEEMLARMRERQHKTSMQPMSNSNCQLAVAQADTPTAAANSRPSRSRKAPAKLEDTVPTEAVLAGMNRSKPVVSKSLYSQQQQQQHWHLQDRYSLQKQEQRHPLSLFQQHLQLHAGFLQQQQQQQQSGRRELSLPQLLKQQLHNKPNHHHQQQQGSLCGLPPGMSIIAGLSTRQLNAALAAARATAPRAATAATDAELNLSSAPPAGMKASTGVVVKPAMAASLPLTKESAVPNAAHGAHSGSTASRSAGDVGMPSSSSTPDGSSAAEQPTDALAAAAGEKQVGSRDAAATPAASAEAPSCNPRQACGDAADGDVNSSSLAAMQGDDKSAAGSRAEASLEVPGAATAAAAALMSATCPAVLSSAAAGETSLRVPAATGAAGAAAAAVLTERPALEFNAAAVQASLKLLPAAAAGCALAQSPAADSSPAAASEVAAAAAAVADAARNLKRRLKPGRTKLQTNRPDPMIRNRSQMEVILLEQQRIKVQEMLKRHRQRQQQHGAAVAAVAGDKQLQTAAGHDKQQEQPQQQQSRQQEAGAPAQRQQAPKNAKRPWMSLAPQRPSNPATTVPFAAHNPCGVSLDTPISAAGSAVSAGRVLIVPTAAVVPSAAASAAAVMAAGKPQSASSAAPISGTAAAVAGPVKTTPEAAGSAAGAPGCTVVMQAPRTAIPPPPPPAAAAAPANISVGLSVVATSTAGAGPAAIAGKQCAVADTAAGAAPSTLTAAVQLASTQQKQQEHQQRASNGVCGMSSSSAAAPQPRTAATTASSLRAKLLAALSADDDCDDKQAPAAATAAQANTTQSTLATGTPVNGVAAAAAAAQQGKGATVTGSKPAGMVNVGAAQQHHGTVAAAAAAKAPVGTRPTAVVLQRIPGSGLVGVPVYVPGMTSQQVVAHVQQQHRQLLLASIQEQQRKLVQGTAAAQQRVAAVVVGPVPGVGSTHQVPAGQ